jgi:hypothetical protein
MKHWAVEHQGFVIEIDCDDLGDWKPTAIFEEDQDGFRELAEYEWDPVLETALAQITSEVHEITYWGRR